MSATTTASTPTRTADPNAPLPGVGGAVGDNGLIAIVWVFFAAATILVTLRLAVRFRQHRFFLSDDYWIMWAWVCLLTMFILQMLQRTALWYFTYLRAGRLLADSRSIYWQGQLKRWQFPIIKLFYTVLWSVKGSFLALFRRLVKPFPILRKLWYCVAVYTFLGYVGCVLQSALACNPPSDYFTPGKYIHDTIPTAVSETWADWHASGKCNTPQDAWMQTFGMKLSTALDVTSDLLIMALPISILPSLQLDIRRKIGLGVAFSLSIIVMSVAFVRMSQVTASTTTAIDIIGLAVWGAIESCTAVMVGSLLPLKALLSRGVQKYSSGKKNTPNAAYASGGFRGPKPSAGGSSSGGHDGYAPNTVSRTVMVGESIPLDDMHAGNHIQKDGGIYVQRSYETTFDETSSREDDEAGIISKNRGSRAV
jgi:hypothetical protein